jgi:hypothetical protein
LTISQKTPKKVTTTKTQILGTITKHAYTVVPTVVTKTKTLTCSIPKRQPYHDPWARIIPTLVQAAALETSSSTTTTATATASGARRRRDAKRNVAADNRAEFLAAREARLADAQVIQKRGLDNSTVTLTELDTSKWATSTSLSTAPATTTWMTQNVDASTTTTSTETFWSGVTKVVITVTAVRLSRKLYSLFAFTDVFSTAHAHQDEDQVHHRQDHSYDHKTPNRHGHDQDSACSQHDYLQGKGWQACMRGLRELSGITVHN